MKPDPLLSQIIRNNPNWETQAACTQADVELFYSESRQDVNEARKICVDCPVIAECFAQALIRREQYGVWGGHKMSENLLRPGRIRYRDISRDGLSAAVRKRIRP